MRFPDFQGVGSERRTRPFAAHYTEAKQTIRVYFSSDEAVENLRSLTQASQLILGGTSMYLTLKPIHARSEYELLEASSIKKAILKARTEALADQVVRLVETQLTLRVPEGRRPKLSPLEVGKELANALGGHEKGIRAVVTASDRNGARPEKKTTFVVCDYSPKSAVETEYAERVVRILTRPGEQHDLQASLYSEIRPRQGTTAKITDATDAMQETEEEMTLTATKGTIDRHLYSIGPLYLPLVKSDGTEVIFQGDYTPLDSIVDSQGRVITEGSWQFNDIRRIFPRPVSTATFFTALEQMRSLSDIDFVTGVQEVGFPYLEIYHPQKHRLRDGAVRRA